MDKIYKKRCRELIWRDEKYGLECFIITFGSHPCCYIDIKGIPALEKRADWDDFLELDIPVHGGITYVSDTLKITDTTDELLKGKFIGWDYAHCDDYTYYGSDDSMNNIGKKYTLDELISDVTETCLYIVSHFKSKYNKLFGIINTKEIEIDTLMNEQNEMTEKKRTIYGKLNSYRFNKDIKSIEKVHLMTLVPSIIDSYNELLSLIISVTESEIEEIRKEIENV